MTKVGEHIWKTSGGHQINKGFSKTSHLFLWPTKLIIAHLPWIMFRNSVPSPDFVISDGNGLEKNLEAPECQKLGWVFVGVTQTQKPALCRTV